MPRGRRYFRRSFRPATQKYSSETSSFNATASSEGNQPSTIAKAFAIVPATTTFGVRKVKNVALQMECFVQPPDATPPSRTSVVWALVFSPEGQALGSLNASIDGSVAISLYEPNQHVIMQGVGGYNEAIMARTRLARNLQAGDSITLLVKTAEQFPAGSALHSCGTVNFAITY
jgi:hypothetical protein